jgi:hypothetical protein
MKNITRHTGELVIVQKLKHSRNGNPRYLVMLDGYAASTMTDCSLGYAITNFEGKQVTADIGTHYGTVSIQNVKLVK